MIRTAPGFMRLSRLKAALLDPSAGTAGRSRPSNRPARSTSPIKLQARPTSCRALPSRTRRATIRPGSRNISENRSLRPWRPAAKPSHRSAIASSWFCVDVVDAAAMNCDQLADHVGISGREFPRRDADEPGHARNEIGKMKDDAIFVGLEASGSDRSAAQRRCRRCQAGSGRRRTRRSPPARLVRPCRLP